MTQTETATSPAPTSGALRAFPRYPAYRDSGVPWLGQVPAHWEVKRLKWTVQACQNGTWGDEPQGDDSDILCVRVADFDRVRKRVAGDELTKRSVPNNQRQGRVLKQGDLLLEKSGGGELQPVGAVVLYDRDEAAVCSNFIARMPVAPDTDAEFLCYLHAALYDARVNTRSIKQNTGIQNLDSDAYLSELAAFPALGEQRAIAAFLDRETARLDALVAAKQRLIGLLREKRAALISRAVTLVLDASAPLRDSGVPWLGQVPAHWEVKRLKWVAELESGHTPSRTVPEYWENCTIPWVTLNDVSYLKDHDYISEPANLINELGLQNSSARVLPAGTVILSRDATVGRCGILARPMATSQHFVNWVCSQRLLPEYLLYVFRGPMQQEFLRLTMGATIRTIGMPDVNGFRIPLPPLDEQGRILSHIRSETAKLDALVSAIERQIERLGEYRTALIAAAVTGRIDVREGAAHA